MGLSPKERRKIYEEEKARIEAREKPEKGEQKSKGESTTSLKPNVAGLLCYLGFWVTGIIFLFIERRNRLVRFHAMQSLVTFGILNIIWGIALEVGRMSRPWGWGWWGWGGFFNPVSIAATVVFIIFFVLWWVFWAVGMYKAYHGTPYRLPWFSNLAERCLAKLDAKK